MPQKGFGNGVVHKAPKDLRKAVLSPQTGVIETSKMTA
jgi:hypothetical protein